MAPSIEITELDQHLFNEGTHRHVYRKLGAHYTTSPKTGTQFAVWAPNAKSVSLIGDHNGWDDTTHPMAPTGSSGIWQCFVPGLTPGSVYKYRVFPQNGDPTDKADPYGFEHETPPHTASIVSDLTYAWGDETWMKDVRPAANRLDHPISIYEVHLGSWMRNAEEDRPLSYRELAPKLADYVTEMGFTHVEFMPVMEHPFGGSWGYQVTGYFAPTHRFGSPTDFMFLVDHLHQKGIGVILDWVPAHFPTDSHGLDKFDGTALYEHADPKEGFHPDWTSNIFNYGRHEVKSFLISSALFWLDVYHIDGLRVDGVASMLYRDYSRKQGEWVPNKYGGRENLEAIDFLRALNEAVYGAFPDAQMVAEESTAWPMVSKPTYIGGLGFGMKWDMGWMHDTLSYAEKEPIHRRYHHDQLTFRSIYAFHENFVLPLSHDEVVHGKGSLLTKMPGDDWQQFANLRLLLGAMYAQPGKKLLFMGGEFGQRREWQCEESLDWHLLDAPAHAGIKRLVRDLNHVYSHTPALHELDTDGNGFEWVEANDRDQSVFVLLRKGKNKGNIEGSEPPRALVALNCTPVPREGYRIGVDVPGAWHETINTDASIYGGSDVLNRTRHAEPVPWHGRPHSLSLSLPPLGAVFMTSP